MTAMLRVGLTARTVRHLRPSQVLHRARLRLQRKAIGTAPKVARRLLQPPPVSPAGWPVDFTPLDARDATIWADVDALEQHRIRLLDLERPLGDWRDPQAPQLWRYHLHYWDWAWSLVHHDDRLQARAVFRRLLGGWQEHTRFGRWDEWSPYVVSLRAWSWCGQYDAMVRGSDVEDEFVALLALHARYLEIHLELDVGGNHLIKNLKALVGLSAFAGDDAARDRALARLRRAVARQVLPDGGHEERAPAYHCQVLRDLIDLDALLGAASPAWLPAAVERMRTWLGLVLLPDGTVPLLNDGFPVPARALELLQPGPPAPEGLTVLAESGLAVLRSGDWHVLADIGLPCPDDLPAHAHADTLGFLLYDGSEPVVSEVFTSSYAAGPVRAAERGTAGHSTVQVDGADSTEVWGAFRAARRARPTLLAASDEGEAVLVTAAHDGFRHLPGSPVHTRTWRLTEEGLRMVDEVTGGGEHDLVIRLHGTARSAVRRATGELTVSMVERAVGWEQRRAAQVLEHAVRSSLPWQFEVELTRESS